VQNVIALSIPVVAEDKIFWWGGITYFHTGFLANQKGNVIFLWQAFYGVAASQMFCILPPLHSGHKCFLVITKRELQSHPSMALSLALPK